MFANETEVAAAIRARKNVYLADNYSGTPEEVARQVLTRCKELCLSGQYYGKENNRPWQLVDFSKELSASSAWVGFEFEMGFKSDESRRKVVRYVWDNINHSAQDREGYGDYILEATFKPQNFEEYTSGRADILKLYEFIDKEKINLSLPAEGTGACGTHANISTPLLRKLSGDQARAVVQELAKVYAFRPGTQRYNTRDDIHPNGLQYPPNTFQVQVPGDPLLEKWVLTGEDKTKFFGRASPYGWCNFRAGGHYIEFKVFASTAKPEKFLGAYLKTTQCLIDIIDTYAQAILDRKPFPQLYLKEELEKAHAPAVETKKQAVPEAVAA